MAAIRDRNTTPELSVRRTLHAAGLRYRLHANDLPGRPDIVLAKYKAVVFVHGCFWHHHGCANSVWPKTRRAFWRKKIGGNMVRDQRNSASLKSLGWRVFVVWECEVRNDNPLAPLIKQILLGQRSAAKPRASP